MEVKDRGMREWGFGIGLLIVRVVCISRNVTRAFLTTKSTKDTKTKHGIFSVFIVNFVV